MQKVVPKVGQVWIGNYGTFTITRVNSDRVYHTIDSKESIFADIQHDGKMWLADYWVLENSKPNKVIPDMPLDPTLHILEAGYIQDRARKRFK